MVINIGRESAQGEICLHNTKAEEHIGTFDPLNNLLGAERSQVHAQAQVVTLRKTPTSQRTRGNRNTEGGGEIKKSWTENTTLNECARMDCSSVVTTQLGKDRFDCFALGFGINWGKIGIKTLI